MRCCRYGLGFVMDSFHISGIAFLHFNSARTQWQKKQWGALVEVGGSTKARIQLTGDDLAKAPFTWLWLALAVDAAELA
jgi:hypothetical protein